MPISSIGVNRDASVVVVGGILLLALTGCLEQGCEEGEIAVTDRLCATSLSLTHEAREAQELHDDQRARQDYYDDRATETARLREEMYGPEERATQQAMSDRQATQQAVVDGRAVVQAEGAVGDRPASCDPNYGGCVPGDRDYDCRELHAMGIGNIPVLGTDWQRLDGYLDFATGVWTASPNGLGCEWGGE